MNMYGYGCVVAPNKSISIENTKAYKELTEILGGNKNIFIDLVTRADRNRPVLENLLTDILKPNDVLVLNNINALGNTGKLAAYNYKRLIVQQNYVFIPVDIQSDSPSEYSTANAGGKPITSFAERQIMFAKLESIDKLKNNQGMIKSSITVKFINTYWQYELFKISDVTACAYLGISLNTFRTLCKKYETDTHAQYSYFADQQHYEDEYKISKLPKRFGGAPKCFDKLIEAVETTPQIDVETASVQLGLPKMDNTLFRRYYLKYIGGKKILSMSAVKHLDKDMSEKLLSESKKEEN